MSLQSQKDPSFRGPIYDVVIFVNFIDDNSDLKFENLKLHLMTF